jgi:hypothetical protein
MGQLGRGTAGGGPHHWGHRGGGRRWHDGFGNLRDAASWLTEEGPVDGVTSTHEDGGSVVLENKASEVEKAKWPLPQC